MAKKKTGATPAPAVPDDLAAAIAGSTAAAAAWAALSASCRREYVAWVEEAKRPATRQARIAKAVDMIPEV
ncbi:MAG: YdeI/OmpD-associated family protein [Planctomycetes bacterium]|nr:YdeI/OmpD-associated family protein [Planctomycetota bacterium]